MMIFTIAGGILLAVLVLSFLDEILLGAIFLTVLACIGLCIYGIYYFAGAMTLEELGNLLKAAVFLFGFCGIFYIGNRVNINVGRKGIKFSYGKLEKPE